MRAHTVSFVLASRTPSHIVHINIHLHAEELLSSPFEFSDRRRRRRRRRTFWDRTGELLLRCDCDYPLLLLCAHHFFVGLWRVSDEVLFLQLGMRRREDERGSGIKLDLVPLTSSWLIWYAPTKEYNSVLSNWVACLAVLCSTKDQRVVGGWRMDCQNTGIYVSVCVLVILMWACVGKKVVVYGLEG